ncbi:ankyrin repeat-containing domain protein [Microdochium bolleyi]|uniref:Ankyrin repeat-containing domain protein n=1 Tax=Microdochium bolleyi TaxID=196109 RepID=A0A136IQT5_9PEZI|nr:ankyrin repeat-containing domain protein [Microdochium bolleyi]
MKKKNAAVTDIGLATMLAGSGSTFMSGLPPELLALITKDLSLRDALAFAAVNRTHHETWTDHLYESYMRTTPRADQYRPLWWAAGQASPAALRTAERAIRLGADPSIRIGKGLHYNEHYSTPLLLAINNNDTAMVELLLARGANPCIAGETHRPLTLAASTGKLDMLKILLSYADRYPKILQSRDRQGLTALSAAALPGNDAAVRVLLDGGVDVNILNLRGRGWADIRHPDANAIYLAMYKGWHSTVDLLLSRGADPLHCGSYGASALTHAINQKDTALVRRFLEVARQRLGGADTTQSSTTTTQWLGLSEGQCYGLIGQAAHHSRAILQVLIEFGISVDARDVLHSGDTLLFSAIVTYPKNKMELLRALLDAGADVNAYGKDPVGWTERREMTPLMRVAEYGFDDMVKLLLAEGADATLRDSQGCGVLTYAAGAHRNPALIGLLLDHGRQPDGSLSADFQAQLELRNENGHTPLLIAARRSRVGTELLLRAGADINVCDPAGLTALAMAAVSHDPDIARILVEHGARLDAASQGEGAHGGHPVAPPWGVDLRKSWPAGIEGLIDLGMDVDLVSTDPEDSERQQTLLVAAVRSQLPLMVEMLLRKGASLSKALECDPGLLDFCRQQQGEDGDMIMGLLTSHMAAEVVVGSDG